MDLATNSPPQVTQAWLQQHGPRLNDEQVQGISCVYCGGISNRMFPVGRIGNRELIACLPACEESQGADRP